MIEQFIENVKDLSELITEFNESLWAGLVDGMKVCGKIYFCPGLRAGWRLNHKLIAGE